MAELDRTAAAVQRLFALTCLPTGRWKSARTTNAIERLREECERRIRTRTVPPPAETAAMLSRALPASGQVTVREVDGRWALAGKPTDRAIDLAA